MVDLQVRRLGRTEMKPKAFGLGCGYLGLPELTSEEFGKQLQTASDGLCGFRVDSRPAL